MINPVVALVRLHDLEFGLADAAGFPPERVQAETVRCRSELDRPTLARFDQLKRHYGSATVVEVVGGSCSGCRMAVPSTQLGRIRKGQIGACDNCGRYVYSPEFVYRFQF